MDLSLWFRIAASSITLSDFYDDLVIILDHRVICIYDYSGWANVMVFSRYQVFERYHLWEDKYRVGITRTGSHVG